MTISKAWPSSMLKKLNRLLSSFKSKKEGTTSPNLEHRRQPDTPPQNIYHRCSDTPLSIFITCSVDKDYSGLKRYGHATQLQLQEAWQHIYSEYSDLTGGQSYKLIIGLSKDIGFLRSKLLTIGLCLKVLTHRPDAKCIQLLANYGYKYFWNVENREQYQRNIEEITIRAGGVQIALAQKEKEYEETISKLQGSEVTRQTYENMLTVLSKHMGYRVNPAEVTVSEFVSIRNHYTREIELLKKQSNG